MRVRSNLKDSDMTDDLSNRKVFRTVYFRIIRLMYPVPGMLKMKS
jgi:hypothetical protein